MDLICHSNRNTASWNWRGNRREKMKLRIQDFLGLDHRAIQLQTCAVLQDKERMIPNMTQRPSDLYPLFKVGERFQQGRWQQPRALWEDYCSKESWRQSIKPEDCSPALRSNGICLTGYRDLLGTCYPFLSCIFFPLKRESLYYVCPSIVFWKHITGSRGSQLERNFTSG